MATNNDTIITVPNMETAAARVMEQARKAIAPDYFSYLIDDTIEVMAMLANNDRQDYKWAADNGGYWSVAFHCTDTGVYSYVFSDGVITARNEDSSSVLVIVEHWQEQDGWQVTIR